MVHAGSNLHQSLHLLLPHLVIRNHHTRLLQDPIPLLQELALLLQESLRAGLQMLLP